MTETKRYTILKIIATTSWILIGMGTVILLIAAISMKKSECCKAVDIHITGVRNNYFIDKNGEEKKD